MTSIIVKDRVIYTQLEIMHLYYADQEARKKIIESQCIVYLAA